MTPKVVPSVSVIVPHYGDPAPAVELVEALQHQQGDIAAQIVVCDDHSPEPFPDVPGVTVVRRETNGGFGSAVNSGVASATGDRLLILNSDLEITPTFVADLVKAAEPWMPAVCGPWIVDHKGRYTYTGRKFPTVAHQMVEWLTPLARWRSHHALHAMVGHDVACTEGATTPVDWLVGAVLYLPTDAFRSVGGFDETFHMNSEEVDLQYRLRQRGVPSIQLGGVRVTHEGGGSSGDTERRRRWLVESRLHYADKWGSRRRLQGALIAATAVNFMHNLGRRVLGRPLDPVGVARFEWDLIWKTGSGQR